MLAASPCVAAAALDQLGHAAGRADRARHAGLGPPAARPGRGLLRAGHGGQALSAVPARPAAAAVPARRGGCATSSRLLSTFVVSWGLVNLPALWLAPDAWRSFWSFNSDRAGDLGSIWYVLSLAGQPGAEPQPGQRGPVRAAAASAIAALIMLAPRRPRFGAVAFLVRRGVPADQQGLLAAVRALAAALHGAGPAALAGLADLHRRRADLLRGHLVASRRLAGPGRQLGRPDLLAGGDRPAGHPAAGWWSWWSATSCGPSTTRSARGGLDDPTGGVLDGAPDADWWPGSRRRDLPESDASSADRRWRQPETQCRSSAGRQIRARSPAQARTVMLVDGRAPSRRRPTRPGRGGPTGGSWSRPGSPAAG